MISFLTPRAAVAITFLCFGLGAGLWGGSVAEVSRIAQVSPSQLGAAFVGFAIAGILGMAVGGKIAGSVSLKHRLLVLLGLTGLCLAALLHAPSAAALTAGLFLFSFLGASVDLVMNAEGVAVEHDLGHPVLASFHAWSSIGVAAGAISGSWLSVRHGVGATALAGLAVYGTAIAVVAAVTPMRGATQAGGRAAGWFRPSVPLMLLGLIVGASISIELSVIMFSSNTLAALAPELAAWAGFGATLYAVLQGGVRFAGDRLRAAVGDARLIAMSLALVCAGLCIVMTAAAGGGFPQSVLGFALVGIGTACIVPAGFALSPRFSGVSAVMAISMLSMIGAPFRIASPLTYGAAAERHGFSPAYAVFAALAALALGLALLMLQKTRTKVTP